MVEWAARLQGRGHVLRVIRSSLISDRLPVPEGNIR